jgi:hypothetical protein
LETWVILYHFAEQLKGEVEAATEGPDEREIITQAAQLRIDKRKSEIGSGCPCLSGI